MNAKLLALLTATGSAVVGGALLTLYVAREGVSDVQLLDAGMDACDDVTLSCLVLSTKDGVCLLLDGGSAPADSTCQLEVNAKNCGPDAGVVPYPDVFDGGAILLADPVGVTCVTTANGKLPNGQKKKLATYFCACAPEPNGTCQYLGQSGTLWRGRTFNSGDWTGSCQPKACTSVTKYTDAGVPYDPTWPANCPQ